MNQTKIRTTSSLALFVLSTTTLLLLLSVLLTVEATMESAGHHEDHDLTPLPILIHLASLPHPEPHATLHPTSTVTITSKSKGVSDEGTLLQFPRISPRRLSQLQEITLVTPYQNPTIILSKNNHSEIELELLEPSADWSGINFFHIPRNIHPATLPIRIRTHNSTYDPTTLSPSFLLLRLSHTSTTNSQYGKRRRKRSISTSSTSIPVTTPPSSDHIHAVRHFHALRRNQTNRANRTNHHKSQSTDSPHLMSTTSTPPPSTESSSPFTTTGCRLHTLALTPEQIQLPGISWPYTLELGFCEGTCPFPLTDDRYNYSLHALYLDKYRLLWNHHVPENMPRSTCVPVTYKSTSLVVEIDGGDYELRVVHDLSVSSCGCR